MLTFVLLNKIWFSSTPHTKFYYINKIPNYLLFYINCFLKQHGLYYLFSQNLTLAAVLSSFSSTQHTIRNWEWIFKLTCGIGHNWHINLVMNDSILSFKFYFFLPLLFICLPSFGSTLISKRYLSHDNILMSKNKYLKVLVKIIGYLHEYIRCASTSW